MIRLLACFFKGMEQIQIQIIFGAMHFVFLSLFFFLLSCLTVIHYFYMLLIYEFDLIILFVFVHLLRKEERSQRDFLQF